MRMRQASGLDVLDGDRLAVPLQGRRRRYRRAIIGRVSSLVDLFVDVQRAVEESVEDLKLHSYRRNWNNKEQWLSYLWR